MKGTELFRKALRNTLFPILQDEEFPRLSKTQWAWTLRVKGPWIRTLFWIRAVTYWKLGSLSMSRPQSLSLIWLHGSLAVIFIPRGQNPIKWLQIMMLPHKQRWQNGPWKSLRRALVNTVSGRNQQICLLKSISSTKSARLQKRERRKNLTFLPTSFRKRLKRRAICSVWLILM